ncbi:MAG: cell division protein PerM [Segniliparus sp.]|uniref:cell division protein PerM n=1 Tax=Segniliparus sp. TaxID=2804064 RepID=UPI003F402173
MVARTVPRTSARQGEVTPNRTRVRNFNSNPNALSVLRDALVWSESRTAREPRSLFTVAFAPSGVLLGLIAALSLVTLVSVDSDLQGAFGAIALVWLAVHQVPVSIADIALGALPLAPTALVMVVVARISAQAASTRPTHRELRQVLAAAMGGPLVITMILLATAKDAATVVPLNSPSPAPALAWVTGIHLVAAGAGILWSRREGFAQALPAWGPSALALGARGALWLFVAGGGLAVLNMIAHWGRLAEGFGAASGPIGLVGVLVISVLYFPNVMVSGIDVLLGATVRLGATSVGVAHAHIGQLPLLPVFSPLVPWHFGNAAFAALAIPALVGAWLGSECARAAGSVAASVRASATSAALASAIVLVGSATMCGKVGVIGRWSVSLPLVGIAAFVLLAVPAIVVAVATTAPAALRDKPEPVVVISPARDKDSWEDSAEEDEAADASTEAAEAGGTASEPETAEPEEAAEPEETRPEAGGAPRAE